MRRNTLAPSCHEPSTSSRGQQSHWRHGPRRCDRRYQSHSHASHSHWRTRHTSSRISFTATPDRTKSNWNKKKIPIKNDIVRADVFAFDDAIACVQPTVRRRTMHIASGDMRATSGSVRDVVAVRPDRDGPHTRDSNVSKRRPSNRVASRCHREQRNVLALSIGWLFRSRRARQRPVQHLFCPLVRSSAAVFQLGSGRAE